MTLKVPPALARAAGVQALLLHERFATGVTFNPLSQRLPADPYPSYQWLRTKNPVHYSDLLRGWVLTRYADVSAVLRDPRFAAARDGAVGDGTGGLGSADAGPFLQTLNATMLLRDPPDHTRLRALVSKAFTPRSVEVLKPRIQEIVDGLLDQVQDGGRMDVIRDLAYPLPVVVIAELLGVPPEDRGRFKRWSDVLAEGIEPLIPPEALRRCDAAIRELRDYFHDLIQERRRRPREDLVSALIAVGEQGDVLNEDELFSTFALLLAAGNEATTNLIGNGLLALLRNSDQYRCLRGDPSLAETAVEELLRYDSPVQLTARLATQDVKLGGRQIRAGETIVLVLGAANRDPVQFPSPDRLDVGRRENRHLSFGQGIHYCLGAPLARAEGQIAFRTLAQRLPAARLAGPPKWRNTITLRGLPTLPVVW